MTVIDLEQRADADIRALAARVAGPHADSPFGVYVFDAEQIVAKEF